MSVAKGAADQLERLHDTADDRAPQPWVRRASAFSERLHGERSVGTRCVSWSLDPAAGCGDRRLDVVSADGAATARSMDSPIIRSVG